MPGSQTKYYVFAVPLVNQPSTFDNTCFVIVDMEENGGLGGMSEEVLLSDAWDADEKICAVKHRNNEDYWVVLRKYMTNQYASF